MKSTFCKLGRYSDFINNVTIFSHIPFIQPNWKDSASIFSVSIASVLILPVIPNLLSSSL